jgi:hypothetical protein
MCIMGCGKKKFRGAPLVNNPVYRAIKLNCNRVINESECMSFLEQKTQVRSRPRPPSYDKRLLSGPGRQQNVCDFEMTKEMTFNGINGST